LNLEDVTQHTLNCTNGRKLCTECHCICKPQHNCVEELLSLNKKENQRIDSLEKEMNSLKGDMNEVKHKCNELETQLEHKFDIKDFLFRYRQGIINGKIEIMDTNMKSHVIPVMEEILHYALSAADSFKDIATGIIDILQKKYPDSSLCCAVYHSGYGYTNYTRNVNYFNCKFIELDFWKFLVFIIID